MTDHLAKLLPEKDLYIRERFKGMTTELWAGYDNPYADEIMENELYDANGGLFQYMVPEENIPNIVVAIRKDNKIVSYTMLSLTTCFLETESRSPFRIIGSIGTYTDPWYRKCGFASIALQRLDQYMLEITNRLPPKVRPAVRTGSQVWQLVSRNVSFPLFALFPLGHDKRFDKQKIISSTLI